MATIPIALTDMATVAVPARWDLLPPGSKGYQYGGDTYPPYHGSPEKWPTGTAPKPIGWYAGLQYDGDTFRADAVLSNVSTYFPGATSYEVAGFFWWQVREAW